MMDARKSMLIVLNNAVGALLGFVGLFFVGRYIGPEALGMVGFAMALVGFGEVLATMGLNSAHVKRVSEGKDIDVCNGTFAIMKLSVTTATVLMMGAAILVWHQVAGFTDATTLTVLGLALAHFFVQHVRSIIGSTFTALRLTALAQRFVFVDTVARVGLTVALALAVAGAAGRLDVPASIASLVAQWDTNDIAAALTGTYLAGVLAGTAIAALSLRRGGMVFGRFDRGVARRYIRFALPLALLGIIGLLANRLDTVMVGYFWSATDVGHYFAAQRYALLVAMIPAAVATLFFPLISELASRGQMEGVHAVAQTAQRLLSMVLVPIVLGVVLFAGPLFHILVGDSFLSSAPILAWLALHGWLVSMAVVAGSIVQGFDRPRAAATAGVVALSLNGVLNLLFIPDSILGVPLLGLKGEGAAIATVTSQLAALVLLQRSANRLTGRSYFGSYLVRQLLAGAGAGLGAWAVGNWLGVDRFYDLAAVGVVLGLLYLGLLVAMREFTGRDLAFFRDLLHPGRLARYVRDELKPPR